MGIVVTVVSLVVTLSLVVFVHELGHYLVAKRFGVVVEEFGLGYPPRLLSFGRTEGKIVIGGKTIVIPRRFELPKGLAVTSLVRYQTGTDSKGRTILTRIEEVAPEDPGALEAHSIELLDGGTLFSLNAIPFGGFARMLGEEDPTYPGSLASKSKLARIAVLGAGSFFNLIGAVVFFAIAMTLGAPAVADPANAVVAGVAPGSPAETVGLVEGDVILRANGTEILEVQDLLDFTQAHLGTEVVLTVERDGKATSITIVPRLDPPPGEGAMGITLGPRTTIIKHPWYEAIWLSLKQTVAMIGLIATVPVQLIRGLIPLDMARPVGPVGVGQLVGDAVQYSLDSGWWYPAMQMMGSLSVALAITNLLPLPGLDGGRILFVVVEGIRGRRLDPAKEGIVHLIGLAIMVALMLFITWQDVVNPIPSLDWSSLF
jgi:regulator of sigma E protease